MVQIEVMKDALKPIGIFFLILFAWTLLTVFMSSCSVVKKVSKDRIESTTKTESDSSAVIKSKVTTKITESVDTTIRTPESRIEGRIVGPVFTIEDDNQKITIDNGKVTGIVKLKVITVRSKKTTETKAETEASVKEKEKSVVKVDQKNKAVDVKKIGFPWWLWLILLLVVVTIGYLKFRPLL